MRPNLEKQLELAIPSPSSIMASAVQNDLKLFRSYREQKEVILPQGRSGNPLDFRPNIGLTSFPMALGVHKVIKIDMDTSPPCVESCFTLMSHGILTHEYSMLPDGYQETPAVRPIAIYSSPNAHLKHATIIDLAFPRGEQGPLEYDVALFTDTFTKGHIEFCICEDYKFEWRYEEFPAGSGEFVYYLWRHRFFDGNIIPVARIVPALFRSPIDNSRLWTVEVDTEKLSPHLAFLTAFTVKRALPLPIISSRPPRLPQRIVNVAFNDDHWVFQRSSKFFSDWEEQEGIQCDIENVWIIKVYLNCYLEQYNVPSEVLDFIETTVRARARALRGQYGHL